MVARRALTPYVKVRFFPPLPNMPGLTRFGVLGEERTIHATLCGKLPKEKREYAAVPKRSKGVVLKTTRGVTACAGSNPACRANLAH